jgi:glycosyltransferase involved in cell wall biosynthesis
MEDLPVVSICMITYGHEKFIAQAINGVLMQECNFKIELIVSNDCSPDKTDEVVRTILNTHPKASLIKYFRHEKNVGVMPNFIFALQKCRGRYVALCDGDDYWIDALKLQKQVDFLDANPDYVIHSANAAQLELDSDAVGNNVLADTIDRSLVLEDFLANNNLLTCTAMFRNMDYQLPSDFTKVTFGDWFLYVILLKTSGAKAFRGTEVFSVYRIHSGGVMGTMSELRHYHTHVNQILIIHKYLKNTVLNARVKGVLSHYFLQQYRIQLKQKMYFQSLKLFFTNFKYCKTELPFKKYLSEIKHHTY